MVCVWGRRGGGGGGGANLASIGRLWSKVTAAIVKRDQNLATDEKSAIEDRQRKMRATREQNSVHWTPRFFRQSPDGLDWVANVQLYGERACVRRHVRWQCRAGLLAALTPVRGAQSAGCERSAHRSTMNEKDLEAYVYGEVDAIVSRIGDLSLDDAVAASPSASRDVAADAADDDEPEGEED